MNRVLVILATVACILLAAFCAFGFLATFEPPGFMTLRIVYAVCAVLLLLTSGVLIARCRSGVRRGFPVVMTPADESQNR